MSAKQWPVYLRNIHPCCSIIERSEATVGGNHHLVPFLAAAKEPRGVVGDLFLLQPLD